ncbi:MAG: DUF4815 domain-containing protein [Thermotogae bacterium]|nr:DUF4815 domain-containing protein [Thermotogota bacterium]
MVIDGWNENIEWIQNGEPVAADVANRPSSQIWQNLQLVYDALTRHITDQNNPHNVTAEILGLNLDLAGAENLKEYIALIVNDLAGSFVSDGFEVRTEEVDETNSKVILGVTPGRGYIAGELVRSEEDLETEVSLNRYPAAVAAEPTPYRAGERVFEVNESHLGYTTQVLADVIVTEVVTRGTVPGGSDVLSHTPVLEILSVTQGGTTFTEGVDFFLDGNAINWSPGGNEPAPGSSYTVTYVYRMELEKGVHYKDGSNLTKGTYYYFVAPVDSNGKESNFDSTKVMAATVARDGKYVRIYWNAVDGATAYRVYASTDNQNFYFVAEVASTITWVDDYGFWDTARPIQGGGTLPGASIELAEDRYSRAIVLLNDPGIKDGSNILISYVWFMPYYVIVVLEKGGVLKVVEGTPDREPVPPSPPGNALPLAKVYLPGLDPGEIQIYDIRQLAVRFDLIKGILERLERLEVEQMRDLFAKELESRDADPKTGIFADDFSDAQYVDVYHPEFTADVTGDTIESGRENVQIITPEVDPNTLDGVSYDSEDLTVTLPYTEVLEYSQDLATRTIDVAAALFDVEPTPQVWIGGINVPRGMSVDGPVSRPPLLSEGRRIRVAVTGFDPAEPVIISIGGVTLGTITVDPDGSGVGEFVVPTGLIDESIHRRMLERTGSALRSVVTNIAQLLRSAERSLWPTRVTRRVSSQVIRRWTRRWINWRGGLIRRPVTQTVQTWELRSTTVREITEVTRLGLEEDRDAIVGLRSMLQMGLRAEQPSTGRVAVNNVWVTSMPITIPFSVPRITTRREVRIRTRSWLTTSLRSTRIIRRWWAGWMRLPRRDPVAESFSFQEDTFVTAIAVRFAGLPDNDNQAVFFRFGILKDGFPSPEILSEMDLTVGDIRAGMDSDGWYVFKFPEPILVDKDTSVYFSVGSDGPGVRVYAAQLGDPGVDVNPFPGGTFFYSANEETWTPIQERDLTFRVYTARFQGSSVPADQRGGFPIASYFELKEVSGISASALSLDIGPVTPEGTSVQVFFSDDGGITWKPFEVDRDTPIGRATDKIKIRIVLASTSDRLTPKVVLDGSALTLFKWANSSTYVSSMVEMLSPGNAVDVYVYASVPPGHNMDVYLSTDDGATWKPGTLQSASPYDLNLGIYEYIYRIDTTGDPNTKFRVKIVMSSDGLIPTVLHKVGFIVR